MQADSSLGESKTVSEPPKSRPDYTLAVRRGELRFKNHHPDPRTSRYGQRLVEEILGCRMSGWLTPKLECNKKLQAIPCARLRQEAGRDRTPGFKPSPRPQNLTLWAATCRGDPGLQNEWLVDPSTRVQSKVARDTVCQTQARTQAGGRVRQNSGRREQPRCDAPRCALRSAWI